MRMATKVCVDKYTPVAMDFLAGELYTWNLNAQAIHDQFIFTKYLSSNQCLVNRSDQE